MQTNTARFDGQNQQLKTNYVIYVKKEKPSAAAKHKPILSRCSDDKVHIFYINSSDNQNRQQLIRNGH